jgi:hypothetical protein
MKHFYILLLLSFIVAPVVSPAQDLADNSAIRASAIRPSTIYNLRLDTETPAFKAPEWSKEEDLVDAAISKTKLAKMKEVTGALVDLLKGSYFSAHAYSPTWHGEYFSGKNSPGPDLKFGMTCHFAEQNADLSITANDIQPLLDQLVVNGQHYMTIRVASSVKNEALYYTDAEGADATAAQTKMWLVTIGNGRLPFTPVTRKEYLQEAKAELTAMASSIRDGWKLKVPARTAASQEAEKKAAIDQLKAMYSGADLAVRTRIYLRNYKTDEQYRKENIENETAGLEGTLRLMDSLLAHLPAAELGKPAVVSVASTEFHGFEDGQANYMLIRMNAAYFNNVLSDEKPQLFLVTWHCNPSNAAAAELDQQLMERFDGQKLQEMLGK